MAKSRAIVLLTVFVLSVSSVVISLGQTTSPATPQAARANPSPGVAVVTVPFYFAQPTVFDPVVTQLVLGVADQVPSGDSMVSDDRKYLTLGLLHPLPKVDQLQNFDHAKAYLGWVGCTPPVPAADQSKVPKSSEMTPTIANSPHEVAPANLTSPLEKPGMVFIAPAR